MTTDFADSQLALFDAEQERALESPSKPQRGPTGAELARDGQERALNGAQRDTNGTFAQAALREFVGHAQERYPDPVQITEARLAAEKNGFPVVRERRAWGAVPVAAQRAGYVVHAGFAPSTDSKSHGCPRSLWRWTGKPLK